MMTVRFSQIYQSYSSSDWSRARSFSKVVSVTFSLTTACNNSLRRLSVLATTAVQRDGLVIALGVHVVVVHIRMTPVNDETTPSCLLKTR